LLHFICKFRVFNFVYRIHSLQKLSIFHIILPN
jgi:hypothetical protein